MQNLVVQPDNQSEFGPCTCCGSMSRTVWGYLHADGEPRAVYYVTWTLGQIRRHGANIDMLMGQWGDSTTPDQRVAVSLIYRLGAFGPEFGSIDPDHRPHVNTGLARHLIPARHVLGNPVGSDAYAFVHAIFGQDPRLQELVAAAQG